MKTIEVVAAIIVRNGQVFATQRGYGDWKDWWEFPGGKMEPGESPQEALVREIREELDAEIEVGHLLETVEWDYPDFHLTMHCFIRFAHKAIIHSRVLLFEVTHNFVGNIYRCPHGFFVSAILNSRFDQ